MIQAGVEPLVEYPGANKPWESRCLVCEATVRPTLNSIKSGQGGCKFCARRRTSERQKLSHEEASKIMLEHGLQPLEDYPGNQRNWLCRCAKCGNEIRVRRNAVASNGAVCKFCWEGRRGRALKVPEDQAIAVMRQAGLDPIEPYTNSSSPWRCIHQPPGWQHLVGSIPTPGTDTSRLGHRCA